MSSGYICGPLGDQECRGADLVAEFTRQRDKIIKAIVDLDADVVGLMEIENHATDAAVQNLVAGLNTMAGTRRLCLGQHRPAWRRRDQSSHDLQAGQGDPYRRVRHQEHRRFCGPQPPASGANLRGQHLGRAFHGRGQSSQIQGIRLRSAAPSTTRITSSPMTRIQATRARQLQPDPHDRGYFILTTWLATDPTSSGDTDLLVMGDMNAYAKEDPIDQFVNGGYTNCSSKTPARAPTPTSSTASPATWTTPWPTPPGAPDAGAGEWHINADEPAVIDYNPDFNPPATTPPTSTVRRITIRWLLGWISIPIRAIWRAATALLAHRRR